MVKIKDTLHRISKDRVAYLMLSPMVVGLSLFVVYPILWVLWLGFYDYNGMTTPEYIGLENYLRIFLREKDWWASVLRTLVFTAGKLALELPLALTTAVVLNQPLRGRYYFRLIYFLPSVTSTAVMGIIFFQILQPYQGILNNALQGLGLIAEPVHWLGRGDLGLLWMVLISTWQFFGLNMVLFLSALQRIPTELYESSRLDGAGRTQQFFRITLPMLGKMLQVIVMLSICGSLKLFDLVWVMTRGGPGHQTEVMMTYMYKYFFSGDAAVYRYPQIGFASGMAFIASIIIGIVTGIYLYSTRTMGEFEL